MREIKVRTWDGSNMSLPYNLATDWGDYYLDFDKYCSPYQENKMTIMMYTGLKDCKGFEIYDGDILATSNDGSDGADSWGREVLGDVYWNESFACWNHRADLHDDSSI